MSQGRILRWRRESVLDLYNLIVALVLFGAPWLLASASADAKIDLWASGASIIVVSLLTFVAFSDWEEWVNLLLGVWLIVSPWLLGFAHTSAMHYSIGIGAVVSFLATLELWLEYDRDGLASSSPAPK